MKYQDEQSAAQLAQVLFDPKHKPVLSDDVISITKPIAVISTTPPTTTTTPTTLTTTPTPTTIEPPHPFVAFVKKNSISEEAEAILLTIVEQYHAFFLAPLSSSVASTRALSQQLRAAVVTSNAQKESRINQLLVHSFNLQAPSRTVGPQARI